VRGDDGAVDQGILEIWLVGHALEDAVEDFGSYPAAEALKHAVPLSEHLR
jgi:hypothetical protein